MTRHNAGVANYRGDMRSITGEVKGPTTYGTMLVAVAATYDEPTDMTRVYFAHLGEAEKLNATFDEFGTLRIPSVSS